MRHHHKETRHVIPIGQVTIDIAFDSKMTKLSLLRSIVTKRGVGAFTGTDLGWILRAHHIDRTLLTGLVTHYVVAGTAREAHDLGYGFIVVSDCVVSATPKRHDAALKDLAFLGDIATSEVVRHALA